MISRERLDYIAQGGLHDDGLACNELIEAAEELFDQIDRIKAWALYRDDCQDDYMRGYEAAKIAVLVKMGDAPSE